MRGSYVRCIKCEISECRGWTY